jgi:hypothetical protein
MNHSSACDTIKVNFTDRRIPMEEASKVREEYREEFS